MSLRMFGRHAAYASLFSLAAIGGCPSGSETSGDPDADTDGDGIVDGIDVIDDLVDNLTNNSPKAMLAVSPTVTPQAGEVLTFDASGSLDPDGDVLKFSWSQLSGEAASFSSLSDSVVSVTMPYVLSNTELVFALSVDDGRGGTSSAETTLFIAVGTEFAGHPHAVVPYRNNLTYDEAYHLLRRTSLGAPPWQVQYAVAVGLERMVDELMIEQPQPQWILDLQDEYDTDVFKSWMLQLIEGPNPLRERLAMFWHDRFATGARGLDYRDRNTGLMHWQMIERNSFGNYRNFLRELTLDPLMLIWLDGANSPKQSPNENYAREFWELFTLGRDTLYTEIDIREAARAFTGITLLRPNNQDPRPIYDLLNHDETIKTIFPGRAAPANFSFESVIDLTLVQPEAPRYVARNLFRFFVHDEPSDAAVQELADFFVNSGYEIKPLVRKILTSQALFSSAARGNQISSPVEHVVGVARTLEMHVFSEDSQGYLFDQLCDDLSGAGMELLNPPGVQGWDEGKPWLQDQWIISRARALSRTMEYGPYLAPDIPLHLLPAQSTWNVREVRDQIVNAMASVFHLPLTAEERAVYIEVLDQNGYLAFHLGDPRYQGQHVFEMIRLMAMDERVLGR
ncbi:MAG: DUF1800 family protein [Phycisphaerae bacterium]